MKTFWAVLSGLILTILSLVCAVDAHGEEYYVQKNECISLIGSKLGVNWRVLARNNGIYGPHYTIYPQQRIVYRKTYKRTIVETREHAKFHRHTMQAQTTGNVDKELLNNLGASPLLPFLGIKDFPKYDFDRLGQALGLNQTEIRMLKDNLLRGSIRKNYILVKVARTIGRDGLPVIKYSKMVFSRYRVTYNRRPNWEGTEYAFEVKICTGKVLHFFIKCGNVGLFVPPQAKCPPPTVQKQVWDDTVG